MSAIRIAHKDILVQNPKGGDSVLLNQAQAHALLAELFQHFITNPDFWQILGQLYKIHGYDNRGQQIFQIVRVISINHGRWMHDRFGFYSPAVTVENLRTAEPTCVPLTHFLSCNPISSGDEE